MTEARSQSSEGLEGSITSLPLFERAYRRAEALAVADPTGEYHYRDLLNAAGRISESLIQRHGGALDGARVAFLVPPGFDYVSTLWGIWHAGGVGVPMALAHPSRELAYTLADSDAALVVADPDLRPRLPDLGDRPLATPEELREGSREFAPPRAQLDDGALLLYTSGTTGKPKGVVIRHRHIQAQVETLGRAWGWSAEDRILEILPLHHVHGLINVVTCALWHGAVCEVQPRFDAHRVWERLASGELTLFMAVPTIYHRLVTAWEEATEAERGNFSRGARDLRLMVSGSAALPVPLLETWHRISGHTLLERYGMTEIGMALSNPLEGPRRAGCVGAPLPDVELRLVDDGGKPVAEGTPGQIEVKGPSVFDQYWRRPEATREAFREGWFQTGDRAVCEEGVFRILGRESVDILKSGGEKLSALEIESVLLEHPAIRECAVVGLPDPDWGQRVTAAVVLEKGAELDLSTLRSWAKEHLAVYKVPRELRCLESLPRNPLGKVTKPALVELLSED